MKKKKLIWNVAFFIVIYLLISLLFYFVQEKVYGEAIIIYSFELFCLPIALLVIFLLVEKEKRIVIYLFDIGYVTLGFFLLMGMLFSKILTVEDATQLLQEKGYQEIECIGSCTKEGYNEIIVSYSQNHLDISLTKSKAGVYIFEGELDHGAEVLIIYLESGEIVKVSEIDKNNELETVLKNALGYSKNLP